MSQDDTAKIKAALREKIKNELLAQVEDRVETAYKAYQRKEDDRLTEAVKIALGKGAGRGGGRSRSPTINLDDETCEQVLAAIRRNPDLKIGEIKDKLSELDTRVVAKTIAQTA